MAIYGVATQRRVPGIAVNFYSPTSTANFFREAGTYIDSYNPTAAGFNELASIVTPVEGSTKSLSTTLGGCAKSNGGYASPVRTIIQANTALQPGNWYHWVWKGIDMLPVAIKAPVDYKLFGKLATPPTSSYGFKTLSGINSNLAIDENFKSIYLHRTSTGSATRTGVSRNLQTKTNNPVAPNFDKVYSAEPNIIFDKPYDKPPIIVILETTLDFGNTNNPVPASVWYVALHSLQKNAQGKYISATVVSPRTIGSWVPYSGITYIGFSEPRTCEFKYAIFSEELPLYAYDTTSFGMRVNNQFGEIVFDSKYEVVNTQYINLTSKPRLEWNDSQQFYGLANTISFSNVNTIVGMVLNDFISVTGRLFYTARYEVLADRFRRGPMTLAGRFVGAWIKYDDGGTGVVTPSTPVFRNYELIGYGTTSDNGSLGWEGPYTSDTLTWERSRYSVDFHINEDTGFSLKFLSYIY